MQTDLRIDYALIVAGLGASLIALIYRLVT